MKLTHKQQSVTGLLIALSVMLCGFFLNQSGVVLSRAAGITLLACGLLSFLWGCCAFSLSKGCGPAWGLLGLLAFFGPVGTGLAIITMSFIPASRESGA